MDCQREGLWVHLQYSVCRGRLQQQVSFAYPVWLLLLPKQRTISSLWDMDKDTLISIVVNLHRRTRLDRTVTDKRDGMDTRVQVCLPWTERRDAKQTVKEYRTLWAAPAPSATTHRAQWSVHQLRYGTAHSTQHSTTERLLKPANTPTVLLLPLPLPPMCLVQLDWPFMCLAEQDKPQRQRDNNNNSGLVKMTSILSLPLNPGFCTSRCPPHTHRDRQTDRWMNVDERADEPTQIFASSARTFL